MHKSIYHSPSFQEYYYIVERPLMWHELVISEQFRLQFSALLLRVSSYQNQ